MKKGFIVLCLTGFLGLTSKTYADDTERGGRLGLGTSVSSFGPGFGLRYWATDRVGFDAAGYFSLDSGRRNQSYRSWGTDENVVYTLKKKGLLRLNGLFGGGYDRYRNTYDSAVSDYHSSQTIDTYNIGIGLGVEYSFQEIPDLGFEAFVSGVGIAFVKEKDTATISGVDLQTTEDKYRTISSSPRIGLGVHYYF